MTRRFTLALPLLALPGRAADLTGTWNFDVQTDAGSGNPVFELKQTGDQITGTYKGILGEQKVSGAVKGSTIRMSFKANSGDGEIEITYEGAIESADSMKGKSTYGSLASGTWTAKKAK